MPFKNSVIQKIYRDYSLDESILFLKNELKTAAFEKGVLMAELEEARHEIQTLKSEISELKELQNRKKQGWQSKVIGLERHIEKLQKSLYEKRNHDIRSNTIQL